MNTRTNGDRRDAGLRSRRWFDADDLGGFIHRASLQSEGVRLAAGAGKPIVGICNSWSELVNCNLHFRGIAQAVKRGVLAAGGVPLEFPTISLGENLMKPTAMMFRNLMAMDVEETIRSNPLDAVVLLGGCDKTVPAQLMGAASADVPALMIGGGPAMPTVFRGERLGSGTDLWKYVDDRRAGRMSALEWAELEAAAGSSSGHCTEMGTASTMAVVTEALGMALTGSAAIPALGAARVAAAEAAGRRAVELALDDLRPADLLTPAAFDNAVAALVAIGGSTNAVIHLVALAGRVGLELPPERFAEISARVPLLANIRPAGSHLFEDMFRAGGVPALLAELLPLLDGDAVTVSGKTLAEDVSGRSTSDPDVIGTLDRPFGPTGGLTMLRGSLCPDGAVMKRSAASERLLNHRGAAVVFDGIEDLLRRIDDPDLAVDPDSVLILRNAGPLGAPGMPEWGMLPIPTRLLEAGVDDMVRISDARMSGTGFGTVIVHATPEAVVGGPLALVRDEDPIVLDADSGTLEIAVEADELARRRAAWTPPEPAYRRGYGALFSEHVLQADKGCDFDLLRADPEDEDRRLPPGLLEGWLGGW